MGLFDNNPPVPVKRPLPDPPVQILGQEESDVSNQKRSFPWEWIVIPFSLVICVLFVYAGIKFIDSQSGDKDGGGETPKITEVNPAEYFIANYREGLRALYEEAADKAGSGDFKDIQDAMEFVKGNTEEVKTRSFVKMADELETINGEDWSDDKAEKVFSLFAKGFQK